MLKEGLTYAVLSVNLFPVLNQGGLGFAPYIASPWFGECLNSLDLTLLYFLAQLDYLTGV